MRHVLVVDDNEDYADNIAEILRDVGHGVSVAARPSEALAIAERQAFQLALLDIKMPEMDGVQLLGLLKDMQPEARYFMMTGFTRDERIADAMQLGAVDVFPKPVDLGRLIEIVGGAPA